MNTFPYHAMTRPYAGDSPRWRTTDGGIASLMLGSGILRTRAELGQAIWAVDLQFQGLTQADASTLWSFYLANRAATFYWSDPKTSPFASSAFATYECRFDPATPPDIAPSSQLPDRYDAAMTLLPVVPTVAEEMLVAHWKMNDSAATTDVVDDTGNGHTGTASVNTDTLTTTGKINSAFAFTGSQYVTVPDHADFSAMDAGSWCAWFKSSAKSQQNLIAKYYGGYEWYLYQKAAGQIGLRLLSANNTNNYIDIASSNAYNDNAWHFVTAAWDGSDSSSGMAIYIDGVAVSATRSSGGVFIAINDTSVAVTIGALGNGAQPWTGCLDDIRIYKRPLSAQEIRAIYNSGSGTEEVIVP